MHLARYAPETAFPSYSYVPGKQFPHPVSDPRGHSYNAHPAAATDDHWQQSERYRYAIDLFNHGYYWEAHEVWESVWMQLGRTGNDADFVKGLIKLAAAGVKAREGNIEGVKRHARRSHQLFREVQARQPGNTRFAGFDLAVLLETSATIAAQPAQYLQTSDEPVVRVFPLTLSWQTQ